MKNQYITLTILIALLIVACGNSTYEETISLDNSIEIVEEEIYFLDDTFTSENETAVEIINENSESIEDDSVPIILINPITNEETELMKIVVEPVIIEIEIVRANHSSWDALTKKYVTATGKVNYKGMKADLSKIKAYLKHLEITPPKKDWSKNEKLAYWINLYNASTVHLIAFHYPTKSITKLSGGKPWDKKFVKSGTKTYSLNDIENNIIRPIFKDPRIHAALNCAAVSCPKLMNGAYLPSKLSAQLNKQTKAWINDSSKNKINGNKVQVSQIFDWYKVDFKTGGGIIAFINKYYIYKGEKVETKAKITYLEYDWALNE